MKVTITSAITESHLEMEFQAQMTKLISRDNVCLMNLVLAIPSRKSSFNLIIRKQTLEMTIAANLFCYSVMNTNSNTRINQIDDEKFYGSGSSLRPDVEVELMFFVIFMEEFEIGVISCNLKKCFCQHWILTAFYLYIRRVSGFYCVQNLFPWFANMAHIIWVKTYYFVRWAKDNRNVKLCESVAV